MHYLLNYIIWNANPELFSIGWVSIRWYGLLFAMGFLIGQWIFSLIFKWENKPERDLETLLIYMVLATVLGARLGHCLFYQPDYFLAHPIEILYIWQGGLASHGAAIAIIIALYLYSRKRVGQSFLWVTDRIVIVVALGGALIRMGNLMNSEIIGKPSNEPWAFVFAHSLDEYVKSEYPAFENSSVALTNKRDTIVNNVTYTPIIVTLNFDKRKINIHGALIWVNENLERIIDKGSEVSKHYKYFGKVAVLSNAESEKYNTIVVGVHAIPRHPAQLYEAISSFLLFILLFLIYARYKAQLPEGLLFGAFLIVLFSLRFFYEYLKENQVDFENNLSYNMGQLLSIPAILFGVFILVRALQKKPTAK